MSAAALLIDAHGTLLELEPPAPALRRILGERFGVAVSEEQARVALGTEIAYYRAHLGDGVDAASVAALRGRCAAVLLGALRDGGAAPTARLASASSEATVAALLDSLVFRAFADAPPALAALAADGVRIVVASNWDASLPETLARVGLLALVDGVVSSAAAGAAKPDPALFREALRVAGVDAARAVHVGDSLAEDIAGARAAGVEAWLVRRDGAPGPAGVVTMRSLAELPGRMAARTLGVA